MDARDLWFPARALEGETCIIRTPIQERLDSLPQVRSYELGNEPRLCIRVYVAGPAQPVREALAEFGDLFEFVAWDPAEGEVQLH